MTTSIILLDIGKLEPLRGQRLKLHHSLRYAASAPRSVKKQSETSLSLVRPGLAATITSRCLNIKRQADDAIICIGRRGKKGRESDVDPYL